MYFLFASVILFVRLIGGQPFFEYHLRQTAEEPPRNNKCKMPTRKLQQMVMNKEVIRGLDKDTQGRRLGNPVQDFLVPISKLRDVKPGVGAAPRHGQHEASLMAPGPADMGTNGGPGPERIGLGKDADSLSAHGPLVQDETVLEKLEFVCQVCQFPLPQKSFGESL